MSSRSVWSDPGMPLVRLDPVAVLRFPGTSVRTRSALAKPLLIAPPRCNVLAAERGTRESSGSPVGVPVSARGTRRPAFDTGHARHLSRGDRSPRGYASSSFHTANTDDLRPSIVRPFSRNRKLPLIIQLKDPRSIACHFPSGSRTLRNDATPSITCPPPFARLPSLPSIGLATPPVGHFRGPCTSDLLGASDAARCTHRPSSDTSGRPVWAKPFRLPIAADSQRLHKRSPADLTWRNAPCANKKSPSHTTR